jgi:hypothetical protein
MLNQIRVSCACLCRIEHQGRFLLLLNNNRRSRGIYVLSPIGGAISLYDGARLHEFDAVPEDTTVNDLRMTMPYEMLPSFGDWFYSGQGRERSPFRELQEELVTESRLLPALAPEDVEWRYLWTVEEESFTMRRGQTGLLTHYYLEIYEVKFLTAAALGPLLAAPSDSGAVWVTVEQISASSVMPLLVDGEPHNAQVNGQVILRPPTQKPA